MTTRNACCLWHSRSAGGGSPARAPPRARDDLDDQARELLAPHSRRRVFASGDLLWREGDDAGMLVAIESGRVKIYRVLPSGSAVTLYLFGPGDVFGFMPFLDGRPYPASAQALEEVTAMVVSRTDLQAAFRKDPEVALALVRLLATRLRQAFDRIERSSLPEVLPRVQPVQRALHVVADVRHRRRRAVAAPFIEPGRLRSAVGTPRRCRTPARSAEVSEIPCLFIMHI